MKSKRQSKGKTIRPTFFVFCEGESEEAYVKYLRSKYRLPIEVCPSVVGLGINMESLRRFKKTKTSHPKDNDYLMYDLDRDDVLKRLQSIKGAKIIASNPCLEFWYLLHCMDQKAPISSADCLSALNKHIPKYKKGSVCADLQSILSTRQALAIERAEALKQWSNPSSDMPLLISDLESISK